MSVLSARWDTGVAISHSHPDLLRHIVREGVPGNVLEIGVAGGGSALCLMELVENQDNFIVTVDPWGSKPYATSGARYGENFQRGALAVLGEWANKANVNWHHFKMDSRDALALMAESVCWYGGQAREYKWSTVFLDGEHTIEYVTDELNLLTMTDNLAAGGVIFIDNANHAQSTEPGGLRGAPRGDSMQAAITQWCEVNGFAVTFIPYPDGDLLAELRRRT